MTILVVDDDPSIVQLLKEYFFGKGYWVESASDGYSAMVAYRTYKPDLVILDYAMPAGSVGDVFDRLCGGTAGVPEVPVIFLTCRPLQEVAMRVHPGRKVRMLSKPVDLDQLHKTMQGLLPGSAKPPIPPGRQ